RRLVSELAGQVESPARQRATRGYPACVCNSGGDGFELQSTVDRRRVSAAHGRTVAELAELIVAPAIGGTVAGQRARVEASNRDRDEHRRGVVAVRRRDRANALHRAPAVRFPSGREAACPWIAAGDRLEREPARDECRRHAIRSRSVAELAE